MKKRIYITLILFAAAASIIAQQKDFPKLTGPYLGQKPPGIQPKIFAPGILSTQEYDEYGCSLSPDLSQFYFTRTLKNPRRHKIFYTKSEEGLWSVPQLIEITRKKQSGEPFVTADGKYLFFGKLVPDRVNNNLRSEIWFSKMIRNQWSKPEYLMKGMYATVSKKNMIYYTDVSDVIDKSRIKKALFQNEAVQSVIQLPENINNGYENAHPFIDTDERYLLFDSNRPSGYGNQDLYVSYSINGTWSKPINLGPEINTEAYDAIPYVSPDGKYLFFTRHDGQGDIYWVDAKVIEELKPDKQK